jgi:hypothetical protein
MPSACREHAESEELVGRVAALEVMAMTALGLHLANPRKAADYKKSAVLLATMCDALRPKLRRYPQRRRSPFCVRVSRNCPGANQSAGQKMAETSILRSRFPGSQNRRSAQPSAQQREKQVSSELWC